jgi:hypothetical protein
MFPMPFLLRPAFASLWRGLFALRARRSSKSRGGILTSDFANLATKFHRKSGLRRTRRRTGRADMAIRSYHRPITSGSQILPSPDLFRPTPPMSFTAT